MDQQVLKAKADAILRTVTKMHWAFFGVVVLGFIVLNVIFMSSWLGALEIVGIPSVFCAILLMNWRASLAWQGLAVRYGVMLFVLGVLSYGQAQKSTAHMAQQSFDACVKKESSILKSDVVQQYCGCVSTQISTKMLWPIGVKYLTGAMTKPLATAEAMQKAQPELVKKSREAVSICALVVKTAKIDK